MNQPSSVESVGGSTQETVEKWRNERGRETGGVVGGVILIGLGMAFLLDRLDLLPDERSFWPIFPILIGSAITLTARDWEGRKGGVIAIGIGFWLWATEAGWADLSWRSSWPLLLIGFGALAVFEALLGLGKRGTHEGGTTKGNKS
jgi:hypothetical protein